LFPSSQPGETIQLEDSRPRCTHTHHHHRDLWHTRRYLTIFNLYQGGNTIRTQRREGIQEGMLYHGIHLDNLGKILLPPICKKLYNGSSWRSQHHLWTKQKFHRF